MAMEKEDKNQNNPW